MPTKSEFEDLGSEQSERAAEQKKNFKAVQLGTVCIFPEFAIAEHERVQNAIAWQQDFANRTDEYILVIFAYKGQDETQPNIEGRLFISTKKIDEFRKMTSNALQPLSQSNWRSFTVSHDFQYGQTDKTGKNRFLVLHDKEQKPYQHRFVNSRWVKAGNLSLDLLDKAGFGSKDGLNFAAEQGKTYLGDYLRNFDGTLVESSHGPADVSGLTKQFGSGSN